MEFETFRKKLKEYLASSAVSQNELSKETGVAQSQISGWVNGNGKRFSKGPKSVMDYIDEQYKSVSGTGTICPQLEEAIISFCGNSREKSKALIDMIEVVRNLSVS